MPESDTVVEPDSPSVHREPTEIDLLLPRVQNDEQQETDDQAYCYTNNNAGLMMASISENIAETFVDGVEFIAERAQDIRDGVVEEYQEVKEALLEELHEADDGDLFFLETGLTRNLSILPEKLQEAVQEVVMGRVFKEEEEEEEEETLLSLQQAEIVKPPPTAAIPMKPPLSAYLTLAGAVIALSSIGPSLDLQRNVDATLKVYWRMTGTAMALFPFALRSVLMEGRPHLTFSHWTAFGIASVCYAAMCVAFVQSLEYTSVGNAVIFSNSQALLLLLGKLMVGTPVSFMEGGGALVAFGGGVLCACDSSASTMDPDSKVAWAGWGDILAMVSALGGVWYLVFAKSLRDSVSSVVVFMFMIMFSASMTVLIFML
jgi:hypothetical protein